MGRQLERFALSSEENREGGRRGAMGFGEGGGRRGRRGFGEGADVGGRWELGRRGAQRGLVQIDAGRDRLGRDAAWIL